MYHRMVYFVPRHETQCFRRQDRRPPGRASDPRPPCCSRHWRSPDREEHLGPLRPIARRLPLNLTLDNVEAPRRAGRGADGFADQCRADHHRLVVKELIDRNPTGPAPLGRSARPGRRAPCRSQGRKSSALALRLSPKGLDDRESVCDGEPEEFVQVRVAHDAKGARAEPR